MTIDTDIRMLPNGLEFDEARREAGRAYELDRKHVFHSWSAQAQINPMTITAAAGSYVWDGDGNRLLDFSSQLVNTNIGHQHPKVVAAIQAQAAKLCTVAPQHDLRVVAAMSSSLMVMKDGKVVERGPAAEIFKSPKSAYTRALFAAAFNLEASHEAVIAQ